MMTEGLTLLLKSEIAFQWLCISSLEVKRCFIDVVVPLIPSDGLSERSLKWKRLQFFASGDHVYLLATNLRSHVIFLNLKILLSQICIKQRITNLVFSAYCIT